MSKEEKCCAGCKAFTGEERYHHKDCVFYPDSMSRLYDELKVENEQLKDAVRWRKVEEELPTDKFDYVLVSTNGGKTHLLLFATYTKSEGWYLWKTSSECIAVSGVTHWLPIPQEERSEE